MRFVAALLFAAAAGCTVRRHIAPPVASVPDAQRPRQREYVDLQPGWRLQIVAPITANGQNAPLVAGPSQSDEATRAITLKASANLLGYETAFWEAHARPGGGVQLHLASATMTRDGVPAPIAAPTKALLHITHTVRFIRVFYLIRKSESDHEMVVAGVDRADRLEPFTAQLRANPTEACHTAPHIYCEWIPYGMAVRPESRKNGVDWSPLY